MGILQARILEWVAMPSLDGNAMVILALVLFPREMLTGEARDL